jgi:2-keto-4-pentenoate hydratase
MPDQENEAAVARGMRAQLARRNTEVAAGAQQVGWKIGFNTPAIQEHFGLSDAVVGYLLDQGVAADGATVPLAGWAEPAVEVEVALRVDAVEGSLVVVGLAPALELVDLGISFDDIEPVLAANICQRGVVFGPEVAGVDPFAVSVNVAKNLEDPTTTATFVEGFLSSHGAVLEPGQRIIAGSLTPPVAVAPGDEVVVTFGPLGSLSVSFS